jgi:ribonuclease R
VVGKRRKRVKGDKVRPKGKTSEISSEQVLEWMAQEDRPLLLKEILRHIGLQKSERQEVRALLRELADQGKIVKIRGNRYGLPTKMNLVVGKVRCHPDGYGFVISEKEGEEDVFISPRNLKEAMHGDRVVARIESIRKKGREGSVIRILERKTRKVVGKFMRGKIMHTSSQRMSESSKRSSSLRVFPISNS